MHVIMKTKQYVAMLIVTISQYNNVGIIILCMCLR